MTIQSEHINLLRLAILNDIDWEENKPSGGENYWFNIWCRLKHYAKVNDKVDLGKEYKLEDLLCSSFSWSDTEEGFMFWDEVYDRLETMNKTAILSER